MSCPLLQGLILLVPFVHKKVIYRDLYDSKNEKHVFIYVLFIAVSLENEIWFRWWYRYFAIFNF